jgi:hypothetical protein
MKYFVDLKCNSCELVVRVSCERELTPAEQNELQFRMKCNPCLKKELEAKK